MRAQRAWEETIMRRVLCGPLLALVVFAAGCGLSPEQSAALARYAKAVAEIRERLDSYAARAEEVAAAIREKRVPLAEGMAVLAEIQAGYKADAGKLSGLAGAIEELRGQEVPWWYYLGPVVTALLGLAGGRIPGLKTSRVLGAVIAGVEKSGDPNVKVAIRDSADLHGVGVALHARVKRLA